MRFKKELLQKPPLELTDEELKCIGKHFQRYPMKEVEKKPPLVKCAACSNLDVSTWQWECMATGEWLNKHHTARQITCWRRCKFFNENHV
jgi:hypothetical protein